jgi:AraC family transcriptional regulator, transcriptional activator of pobA
MTIVKYNSMAEFYAAMGGGELLQEEDFTIHRLEQIHGAVPMKSPLFRANYYSIVMINQGHGQYFLDDRTYETKPQTIYFNNPGHVKGFEVFQLVHGYVITFSETFLKRYLRESIFDEFPFLIAEIVPPQYPDLEVFQSFDRLGSQLLNEYQTPSTYKFKIIANLLSILLYKIKETFWQNYNPRQEADLGSPIVTDFKRNLEAHFRSLINGQIQDLYQVQDYAAAQALHPSYLSTVIKTKTGKSVNTWIAEKVVAEAQALLSRSQVTVQQVSTQLGFKEAGHFSRYFKKQTGYSPSDFRRQLEK